MNIFQINMQSNLRRKWVEVRLHVWRDEYRNRRVKSIWRSFLCHSQWICLISRSRATLWKVVNEKLKIVSAKLSLIDREFICYRENSFYKENWLIYPFYFNIRRHVLKETNENLFKSEFWSWWSHLSVTVSLSNGKRYFCGRWTMLENYLQNFIGMETINKEIPTFDI